MTAVLPEEPAHPADERLERDGPPRSAMARVAAAVPAIAPQELPPADPLTLYDVLLAKLAAGTAAPADRSWLVDEAARVWSRPGFDTFLSVPGLRFEPFGYQLKAAQTVLRLMRGRAILADEVGLGKTIEAGLVLSELRLRGMAGRSLVIAPAGLVEQWREELERKFGLATVIVGSPGWADVQHDAILLASLAAARREPLKSLLAESPWDTVIIDEAHRVRGPRSASGRLARALRARHLLLLTATPVENQLQDLYELVSLVSPGLLGTPAQFRARHIAGSENGAPRDIAGLRAATAEVMVRHRRSEVALMLPQRLAETVLITPGDDEAALYTDLTSRIRAAAAGARPPQLMALRSLARLAGSSPAAAAPTLAKIGWEDLAERSRGIGRTEKLAAVIGRIQAHSQRGEQVLVFTAYRRTLDELAAGVAAAGVPAAVYHGSLPRQGKEDAIASFRDGVPVLLSTESAGEGRNIQFCHVMINMDLPWNPMQIEQRLGRLHRVGQDHEVLLTNFVAKGTIEQRILNVLEAKINLFELVVGELDMILGRVDDDFDFETSVFDAFVGSPHDEEFARRLDALGDKIAQARAGYLRNRASVDALAGPQE